MAKRFGTERGSVQEPLIRYAGEVGWEYVPPSEALTLRKGEGGLFFYRLLEEKLIELNPGLISPENADDVIRRIESARNTIEGNAEILAWLRGEQSVYDHAEKRERNVTVVDFADLEENRNVFQITEEWQYTNGQETNRADVVFLTNGIPVALVETKSARKPQGVEEGLIQIREYHHETPEMLTAPQVFDVTHLLDFYYGATWSLDRKNLFNWRDEEPGNFEKKVKRFFDRERFLTILREWILFYYKEDELRKSILRQHQTRAVEKILDRCAEKAKTTGLIWHTQGSGKTFTMITAARLILQDRETFGMATVILMIDRNELEGQLSGWVERLLGEMRAHAISIEHARNKRRLRELLAADFRGLIVSMIHKFDRIPEGINTRESIFVLVDEAHRTTGGDLGNYLLAALPKATLIGFTGTPIDKTAYGKGTFKVFGKEDERGYLDKYSIAESIEDGTTVPLHYTLAPNEIRVPREQLEEEFLSLAAAEGISDVDDLNKILDHAMRLKTFLKSSERVEKVAAYVARHFRANVEPLGYKAFLVAVDREACALYKEALDRILPEEYSAAVYTAAQHDSEKYPLVYRHQLGAEDEKKARKLFLKAEAMPKILIVTDKLLTGFDAPVLYCMYLDKPMRDHVLLQAIARVNRPYEKDDANRKPCGLVVDFVGIFEKLEKALAFDSDVVSGVIEDLDLLFEKFRELMRGPAEEYLRLCRGPVDDKAVERAIDVFTDKEKREAFFKLYKQIETLYEILSPSPALREFIDDFRQLSVLYQIIRNAFRKRGIFYGDVARKTEMLVREKAEAFEITSSMPVVAIDENTLREIKEAGGTDKPKVINLVNSIRRAALEEGAANPYLRPIGERADAILEAYDERQMTTEQALKRIEALIREILEARRKQAEMQFDGATFATFWALRQEKVPDPAKHALGIRDIFDRFPNYRENASELRHLKAELYKYLLPLVGKDRMVSLADRLLQTRNR
jgi:type I restriction enzyme R subunit